jgi:hypothetical protein
VQPGVPHGVAPIVSEWSWSPGFPKRHPTTERVPLYYLLYPGFKTPGGKPVSAVHPPSPARDMLAGSFEGIFEGGVDGEAVEHRLRKTPTARRCTQRHGGTLRAADMMEFQYSAQLQPAMQ